MEKTVNEANFEKLTTTPRTENLSLLRNLKGFPSSEIAQFIPAIMVSVGLTGSLNVFCKSSVRKCDSDVGSIKVLAGY